MKKIFIIIYIILFLFFVILNINPDDDFYLYNYQELNEKFFPRDEGSNNERKLIKYIEDFCDYYKINYNTVKIDDREEIITNSYNIEIYLKGNNINEEQLIIVCPLNNAIINRKFYDNSISIQIILELIKICKGISLKKNLIFLFSGANEREDSKFDGIDYFLKKGENLNKSIATVINILNNQSKIYFSGSSNRKPIPYEILKKFLRAKDKNPKIYFLKNEIYKARFFLKSDENYFSNFLKHDLPCVSFSNRGIKETDEINLNEEYQKQLTKYFFDWLISLDNIKLPLDLDYHYQYINILGIDILVSETIQIFFLLFVIFFMIIIRLFFPGFQKLHTGLFIKSLPFFIIILIIYSSLTFIPLLIFIPISYLTGITKAYLNFPILYFFNILIIPLLIILISYKFIRKIPFPKHSYLYVFGSFVFSLINLIIFSIFDISYSYIYLWAIIAISISQFTRQNIILKFLCYLISIIPLFILLVDLSQIKNLDVIKNINVFLLNMFFSIFIFPFVLLFLRMAIIIKNRFKIYVFREIIFSTVIVIFILLVLSSLVISTATYPGEKIVEAQLVNDVNKNGIYLALNSKMIIGNISLKYNKKPNEYNILRSNKNLILSDKINIVKPYEIIYKKTGLNYININLNIKSENIIEYLKIYLIAPKGTYPIDTNLIFKKIDYLSKDFNLVDADKEIYQFITPRNIGKDFFYYAELVKNNYKLLFQIEYPFIEKTILTLIKPGTIINSRTIFIEEIAIE